MSSAPQCLADETLFAFVLGQLAPESVAEVERHLSECDDCRAVVAESAQSLAAAEPARSNPEARLRIGRYDLLGLLGAGAYGVVYRAFDPDLRRTVALKVLRPDEHSDDPLRRERMVREAQAMAQLSHPNVVAVYDVGVHSDTIYIVMEYVAGGTARDYLKRESPPASEVLEIYLKAGRGLAAAHAKGLMHRDFKPENVLVGTDGQVRVTDFGLARIAGGGNAAVPRADAQQAVELSTTKGVIGTPGYVAPEQFAGAPADARSDQFSFCVALFSGLYGRHPFRGETGLSLEELSFRVRAGAIEDIPEAARVPKVHGLLLRGLDPDPKQRLPNMDALLAALESALAPTARWKWPALAGAVLAGLLLAAFLHESRRAPAPTSPVGVASSSGAARRDLTAAPSTAAAAAPIVPLPPSASASASASASSAGALSDAPPPRKIVRSQGSAGPSVAPKSREQRYVDGLKEPF